MTAENAAERPNLQINVAVPAPEGIRPVEPDPDKTHFLNHNRGRGLPLRRSATLHGYPCLSKWFQRDRRPDAPGGVGRRTVEIAVERSNLQIIVAAPAPEGIINLSCVEP